MVRRRLVKVVVSGESVQASWADRPGSQAHPLRLAPHDREDPGQVLSLLRRGLRGLTNLLLWEACQASE